MKRFKMTAFSAMLITSAFLTACGANEETAEQDQDDSGTDEAVEEEPLSVYTTLYPLEDFASKIGGDHVEVENIVPVGADAHTFEPTAQQMISVADGDLFIYNGAGFEGFTDMISDILEGENVEIVEASHGIDLIGYDHDHSHDHGHEDDDHDHGHEDDDHGHEDDDHGHEDDDHGHEDDDHGHEDDDHGHEDDDDHSHEDDDHGHEDDDHGHEDDEHGHEDDDDHGHEDDDHGHEDDDHGHEDDDHGHDHHHDHDHGDEDPHVWLDPIRAAELAENVKNALIDLRPEAEEYFTDNFETLKADLEELDEEFQAMADDKDKDTIIVSHAGYGYWDDRYGIHQIGISGISPTNEPSIQQIEETIAYAEENNINYVMFEQNIPTNIAETVRSEVGAEDLWLHNLEALTEEDIENDEDYFSLMRRNLEVLETALNN
ncbi:ABC transporter substrate-binding protein [Alteribacter lacisalsi]|uniref:ABC transporter substrate-binding protein n=1 Tax=Alteribacter lacisalsi TaxID=2045244 RepID=A0A2W0H9M4_9BACI|nr:zinc ABC transporter substrate-binding protein [Alteribacter lacisalsi]PYZ98554.1 ABC transporter substrate-binding protein [Alteribacter lacisalsi]